MPWTLFIQIVILLIIALVVVVVVMAARQARAEATYHDHETLYRFHHLLVSRNYMTSAAATELTSELLNDGFLIRERKKDKTPAK